MRRWFTVFLLILLPLQLSWAVAATYCGHEAGPASAHVGHHAHEHKGPAGMRALAGVDALMPALDDSLLPADFSDAHAAAGVDTYTAGDLHDAGDAHAASDANAAGAGDANAAGDGNVHSTAEAGAKPPTVDNDCGSCHLGQAQPVAASSPTLPSMHGAIVTDSDEARWSTRGPDRRERPNWRAA